MIKHAFLIGLIALISNVGVSANPVTLTGSSITAMVNTASAQDHSTAIPTNLLLSLLGTSGFAKDQIGYNSSDGTTKLSHTVDLSRPKWTGYLFPYVLDPTISQVQGYTFFSIDSDLNYSISGFLTIDDVAIAGDSYLRAFILDRTTLSMLFDSMQFSEATVDESFVLGGSGGDYGNRLIGASTGTLLAGHVYMFGIDMFTRSTPWSEPDSAFDGGSSGRGNITLTIGSVPEPGTVGLLMIGVVGLAAARRRKP